MIHYYLRAVSQFHFRKVFILSILLLLSHFSIAQYSEITTAINNADKNELKSLNKVISFIRDHSKNEHEKAYGVYYWIARNIKYDAKSYFKNLSSYIEPQEVFKKRKAICRGYATLFQYMCNQLNLDCQLIIGYSKGYGYKNGQTFTWAGHGWNTVKIDSAWYLVDVTWASGGIKGHTFKANYTDSYFEANPRNFVLKHLPEIPMWQLMDNPISLKTFCAGDKAITEYLKKTRTPIFFFNDSIKVFLAQDTIQQTLDAGRKTIQFNPLNTSPLAFAMLNSTIYKLQTDSLNFKQFSLQEIDSLIQSTNEATSLLVKAKGSRPAFDQNIKYATNKSHLISAILYYYKSEYYKNNNNLDSITNSFDSLASNYNVYLLSLEKSLAEFRKTTNTNLLQKFERHLCVQYIKLDQKYTLLLENENDINKKKAIQKQKALLVSRAKRNFPPSTKYYKLLKEQLK